MQTLRSLLAPTHLIPGGLRKMPSCFLAQLEQLRALGKPSLHPKFIRDPLLFRPRHLDILSYDRVREEPDSHLSAMSLARIGGYPCTPMAPRKKKERK